MLVSVLCIHFIDEAPGHSNHWLAFSQQFSQLDLHRICRSYVMDDHSDLASITWNTSLPLCCSQRVRKVSECPGSLFKSICKCISTFIHFIPHHLTLRVFMGEWDRFNVSFKICLWPSITADNVVISKV